MVKLKRFVKRWCPPALLGAAHWCYRRAGLAGVAGATHLLSTPEGVDGMIAHFRAAAAVSFDAAMQVLRLYHFRVPTGLPADPESPEYHAAQMALYRQISGREDYAAGSCEHTPFDFEQALLRPFPYNVCGCTAVG